MFQLTTLIIPAAFVAAWLLGSMSLSRGGIGLAEFGPKALLLFAALLGLMLIIMDLSYTPRWVAGSEGYGVIIPTFSVVASLLLGFTTLMLNAVFIRKIASERMEEKL